MDVAVVVGVMCGAVVWFQVCGVHVVYCDFREV